MLAMLTMNPVSLLHSKALVSPYQAGPCRFPLLQSQTPWQVPLPNYAPVFYTAEVVAKQPVWADDPNKIREFKYNQLDGKVDRRSHECKYSVDESTGMPINYRGRTGMSGRGLLGRFGPNHAADPIVSRWKRNPETKAIVRDSKGRPILEVVLIRRKDNGELAIPGGIVDAGDSVSATLKREFGEEALASLEATDEARVEIHRHLDTIFAHGYDVYCGYVDDPRNTDNAWMETVARNFHDATGEAFQAFKLHAGDDAAQVAWVEFREDLALYASHRDFLMKVYQMRQSDPEVCEGVQVESTGAAAAAAAADVAVVADAAMQVEVGTADAALQAESAADASVGVQAGSIDADVQMGSCADVDVDVDVQMAATTPATATAAPTATCANADVQMGSVGVDVDVQMAATTPATATAAPTATCPNADVQMGSVDVDVDVQMAATAPAPAPVATFTATPAAICATTTTSAGEQCCTQSVTTTTTTNNCCEQSVITKPTGSCGFESSCDQAQPFQASENGYAPPDQALTDKLPPDILLDDQSGSSRVGHP